MIRCRHGIGGLIIQPIGRTLKHDFQSHQSWQPTEPTYDMLWALAMSLLCVSCGLLLDIIAVCISASQPPYHRPPLPDNSTLYSSTPYDSSYVGEKTTFRLLALSPFAFRLSHQASSINHHAEPSSSRYTYTLHAALPPFTPFTPHVSTTSSLLLLLTVDCPCENTWSTLLHSQLSR